MTNARLPAGVLLAALGCATLVVACADFELEGRRVRCDSDPSVCADGQFCSADGFCVLPGFDDGGLDDGSVADAAAVCSGSEACEDDNPCTSDFCSQQGICLYEPSVGGECGGGCVCEEGAPVETACGDRIDNDGDTAADCQDLDCPECAGGLTCCPNGACLPSC